MKLGRLIVLAVLVLGMGAYIYFVERHEPSTDELKQREDKLFPAFDQAKIQKVVVTNTKGRFELKKESDTWYLTAPLADEANGGAVTSLLSSLSGLKAERTLEAKDVKLAARGIVWVTGRGDAAELEKLLDQSGVPYTYSTGGGWLTAILPYLVLFGGLAACFGMLAMNGLPMPYHPVFNVPRFNFASRDKFFLCIEATDPKFDRETTYAFLASLDPRAITEVPH